MLRVFEGRTADEVWLQIASAFRRREGTALQSSRLGTTHEILHAALSVGHPLQRWVVSREPPMNPAFAIAEVVWILTGRNDSEFLNYFNRQLPRFAGDDAAYHGAYGHRLRRHFGLDQLDRAYLALSRKPDTRQVVLQTWDSQVDFPGPDGEESSMDVPCNVMSMLKVRGGRLEWTQIVRSNDVFRGLPYNLVQFTTLQEVIAGWLGLEVGTHNQISDSLHLYENCLEHLQASTWIEVATNTDRLALPKKQSEEAFHELGCQIDAITKPDVLVHELASIPCRSGLPQSLRNMLCVLCGEAARRRCRGDISEEIMADCTNAAYKQLYHRWVDRFAGRRSKISGL